MYILALGDSWSVAAIIIGALSGIVGGLVLLYLKSIKQSFDESSESMKQSLNNFSNSMRLELKECKEDIKECQSKCRQNYVDKVDYIREVTKLEDTLQNVVTGISEIKGASKALEQMPKILAQAVRQTVAELNKKEQR